MLGIERLLRTAGRVEFIIASDTVQDGERLMHVALMIGYQDAVYLVLTGASTAKLADPVPE